MTLKQSNYIKIIAMITMLIDHIGLILFPKLVIFRIIGRISFPLFAFQLGVGYENTKSFKKYLSRLLCFGIVIQILYIIFNYITKYKNNLFDLNIFFTLALGLLAIYFYDKNNYIKFLATIGVPFISKFFNLEFDYGVYGVALTVVFYIERKNPYRLGFWVLALSFLFGYFEQRGYYIQVYSIMALLFILKPINLKFIIPNYVFYWFYPIHLALLYTIKIIAK